MSTPTKLAEALIEIRSVMRRRVDAALAAKGLSLAKFKILSVLDENGPCQPSLLAATLNQVARSITDAIDVLERDGLVARTPHPTDRRARLLSITVKGSSLVRATQGPKSDAIEAVFSVLSRSQQSQLLDLLNQVKAAL
jgi:DNA-binding MarR family transcriptional regulator